MADDTDSRPLIYPLEFREEYEPDPDKPGSLRAVEWVKWTRKGTQNGATTEDKVARIRKTPAMWEVLEPFYKKWKEDGKHEVVDGTAIEAWAAVTKAQIKVLKQFHIFSVEDLAVASGADLTKTGIPGIINLQRNAQAFVEASGERSAVAAELAKRDAQIDEMRSNQADMQALIDKLMAEREPGGVVDGETMALPSGASITDARRGPGRPRKTED